MHEPTIHGNRNARKARASAEIQSGNGRPMVDETVRKPSAALGESRERSRRPRNVWRTFRRGRERAAKCAFDVRIGDDSIPSRPTAAALEPDSDFFFLLRREHKSDAGSPRAGGTELARGCGRRRRVPGEPQRSAAFPPGPARARGDCETGG